jgi:7-keto-8-aminopelargonate synthetase-like enzyme
MGADVTIPIPAARASDPSPTPGGDGGWVDLRSKDYLALSHHPDVIDAAKAAIDVGGVGPGVVRWSLDEGHLTLERRLADFLGIESTVIVQTGFMANLAATQAILGPGDLMIVDALSHPSIGDGARSAGARVIPFHHMDAEDARRRFARVDGPAARRRLLATDSVFGLTGEVAPLGDLAAAAQRYGARLLVDEAHAIGVVGEGGRGCVASAGLNGAVDLLIGTFSKALGAIGGFVGSDTGIRDGLLGTHPVQHSTAQSPILLRAIDTALQILIREPGRVQSLRANALAFKRSFPSGLLVGGATESAIASIRTGSSLAATEITEALRGEGVLVQAILPPSVPEELSGIRMMVTHAHGPAELDRAATLIVATVERRAPRGFRRASARRAS